MTDHAATIVVIDNDVDDLAYLTGLLILAGYRCAGFSQASRAIDYIAVNSVALVITAVVMPDLDGVDILRTLKATFPGVPVVALCGNDKPDLYLRLVDELGANGVIAKPVQSPAILRVLKRWAPKQFGGSAPTPTLH
jgi:CheY-like chemotaxis protein